MRLVFSNLFHSTNTAQRYIRLAVVSVTFIITLYYTAYLYIAVPFFGFDATWKPDNVLTVIEISSNRNSGSFLQVGDHILAIDGHPAYQNIWQPLYPPGKSVHTYTIQRDGEVHTFEIPVETENPEITLDALERSLTGLAALSFWVVGALVILFATPRNGEAWFLGFVTLTTSVVLAASEAALYNVPSAWLLSNPFYPLVGVLLVRLAFLPQEKPLSSSLKYIFRGLYVLSIVLGMIALFELLHLVPRGQSVQLLTNISLYNILVWPLAFGATVHIIILFIRYSRMPKSYLRQQILILLVFTGLGVIPGQILTWYPWLFFDDSILPWGISNIILTFIPIGYAFVIYRRSYLRLDIFVTNTLTFLLLFTFWLMAQAIYAHFLRDLAFFQSAATPSGLLLTLLLLVILYINQPTRRGVQSLLYGFQKPYQQKLSQIAAHLSATDPQMDVLRHVFHEAMDLLQVRQAVLMLTDNGDTLICRARLQTEEVLPLTVNSLTLIRNQPQLYHHAAEVATIHSSLVLHDWIRLVTPLRAQDSLVGLLLLGLPVPDGFFNVQDIAFVQQFADMVSVGVRQIQLFESSRLMSRRNLRLRDEERLYLASQIHDVPLQQVSRIATELKALTQQMESLSPRITKQISKNSSDLYAVAQRLRETCAGLYSPLRQQGIQWAVRDAVHNFEQEGNWQIHLTIDMAKEIVVASEVTASVYHTLLEALNNIKKHAQANTIWIELCHTEDALNLLVKDNGLGLQFSSLSIPDLLRAHHFGLVNMYEWSSLVEGDLTIHNGENDGTVINLTISYHKVEGKHVLA